jgi:hypothetical protein
MGRLCQGVPVIVLLLALECAVCGGGIPSFSQPPPRPALQASSSAEIRAVDLSLAGVPSSAELTQIPGRVLVPGLALHPSGALLYQPFLTGGPGSAGVKGGVDILDSHSGVLRL